MMKREPLEHTVFRDMESVRRYDREVKTWSRYLARSVVSVIRKWGSLEAKVLDVGSGTGRLAVEVARSLPGVEVVGLDLSRVALELAKENARKSSVLLRVTFQHGDAEEMPFENNAFDVVVSSNTLHLIKNPIGMFDEIQRVLNPEGKFLISDFRRSWLGIFVEHFRASYNPCEVKELLTKSKLHNWQVQDRFFWLTIMSTI
jgi:ubiquinone/menaquinone biosynthesis C-methylase UbiE